MFRVEPFVEAPDDLRAQADELGYLFCRAALDPALALALRDEILRRPGLDPVALQAEVAVLPAFDALRRAPLGLVEHLLGVPPVAERGDVIRVVAPGEPATPPHQDGSYVQGEGLWTAWIPLGDCPLELGGLAVLPGSHHAGLRPHTEAGAEVDPDAVWASGGFACGDVLLFAGLTLHRAGKNRTGRVRLSADFRYASG